MLREAGLVRSGCAPCGRDRRRILGLGDAPASRRPGEFLAKVSEMDVKGLLGAAWKMAKRIAPAVIEHEAEERGHVPVLVDGTEIEVGGELFEGAGRSHCAERAPTSSATLPGTTCS